jgi:hypothetical protein
VTQKSNFINFTHSVEKTDIFLKSLKNLHENQENDNLTTTIPNSSKLSVFNNKIVEYLKPIIKYLN